jgi:predicted P-loop ATPase
MTTALALPDKFMDVEDKEGTPAKTMYNARTALSLLGMECSYNAFQDRRYVGGHLLGSDAGQVTDDVCLALRTLCREKFKFDPGKNHMWDAVNLACREHSYHPLLNYLASIEWDGRPRLDTWMTDYMNAPDTPFVRAVSRMVLIASVRRILQPGCKFDYITVLESPEGHLKSSALAALYGDENFSDQSILGMSDKELQEAVRGRWGLECSDLSGMKRAEVEKIKAQLSRQTDRSRPAYGRAVIDAPRSVVFWGTTNDTEYLRSQHGNRRFLPIPVNRIDIDRLRADRDQLWAEAAAEEMLGESISLPEALWPAAAAEQEARTERDAWLDVLADIGALTADREAGPSDYAIVSRHDASDEQEERVSTQWLLTAALVIPPAQQTTPVTKRLGPVMRKLGWKGRAMKIGGRSVRGYSRPILEPYE